METAKVYSIKPNIPQLVAEFMTKNSLKITEFAKKVNFSHSTISQYLSGKYNSNPESLENKIMEFLTNEGFVNELSNVKLPTMTRKDFIRTKDATNILAICQSCQDYKGLGLIIGKSGFGKTHTVKYYSKSDRVCYIEGRDRMTYKDMVKAIEKGLGLPRSNGMVDDRIEIVKDFLSVNEGYLIIVDEADKLVNKDTQSKLELLRYLFDQGNVGIVIAGEPRLETIIKASLPRFANRVDFYIKLSGMCEADIRNYLEGYLFTEDAINEMVLRATNQHTGCFRLLERTMRNVDRIVKPGETITLDMIKRASGMMML